MSFDANALLASLLVGSIGFVSFAYGKKMRRLPQMLIGVALMAYPYFVASVPIMLGIGVALLGVLALMIKLGM